MAACSALLGLDDVGYVVDAGENDAGSLTCGATEKLCNTTGACVSKLDPSHGCGGAQCSTCPGPSHGTTGCTDAGCGILGCEGSWQDCNLDPLDGCETNSQGGDPKNCGRCGLACVGSTPYCNLIGGCGSTCTAGIPCEGGVCAQVDSDPKNCGGCGVVCPTPSNATATCVNRVCGYACSSGFDDCDKNRSNGCEVSTAGDPTSCGGCGTVCKRDPTHTTDCVGSKCVYACIAPNLDCNNDLASGGTCECNTPGCKSDGTCAATCVATHQACTSSAACCVGHCSPDGHCCIASGSPCIVGKPGACCSGTCYDPGGGVMTCK